MKRSVKIAAILLALVLIIGSATGIMIAANDSGATVRITKKNIAFGEGIHLAFAIEVTGEAPGYVGLAVWDVDAADENGNYSLKDVRHLTYAEGIKSRGDEVERVAFGHGIAPKDVRTKYVFAPVFCHEITEQVTVGEKLVYSVEDYINEMLAGETTAAQQNMYAKLLAYADKANGLLGAE